MRHWGYSRSGQSSRDNEDAWRALPHPRQTGCLLCAVADGQGGRAGGQWAARLACESVLERAAGLPAGRLLEAATWCDLLCRTDRRVRNEPGAGFTTLVAFCMVDRGDGGHVVGAANGDSALLLHQDRGLEILTAAQFKNPPLGSGAVAVAGFGHDLTSPWALLAMTDGVWKPLGMETVGRSLASHGGQALADVLHRQARLAAGGFLQDDFTLLLIESPDRHQDNYY